MDELLLQVEEFHLRSCLQVRGEWINLTSLTDCYGFVSDAGMY